MNLAKVGLIPASARDDYTQTRYPIVLVHGFLGFDSLLGVYDYWYGIPGELRAGGARVYVADLSSSNQTEINGEHLIRQLDNLRALYEHGRFNLIAHSHGGLAARYVASVRPDLVASVTTVGSPHLGSKVADGLDQALPPESPLRSTVASFVDALTTFIELISGGDDDPQDSLAVLRSLSSRGARVFNALHPQAVPSVRCGQGEAVVDGIHYYSWSGASLLTNVFDVSDALLTVAGLFFAGEPNDGLVSRCSSHLGQVLRDDYSWNHLDEVNQILGARGLFASNPVSVLRTHANRLKRAGL